MTFTEDYRKVLLRLIKEYNWDNIQNEINSFFKEIKRANIPKPECLERFIISESEILNKFNLSREKIKPAFNLN